MNTVLIHRCVYCVHRDMLPAKSSSSPESEEPERLSQGSPIEALSHVDCGAGGVVHLTDLLLEAYRGLGDPDGVYGCGAGRLADSAARYIVHTHPHPHTVHVAQAFFNCLCYEHVKHKYSCTIHI